MVTSVTSTGAIELVSSLRQMLHISYFYRRLFASSKPNISMEKQIGVEQYETAYDSHISILYHEELLLG